MSERFTRVFSLPQNLYAENAPILIEAGAITKDNHTGKVFVQLKIRNITDSKIKAMTVKLNCNDTAGNPVGDPVSYQYLDLDAEYQTVFGNKSAISLPDSASRSFTFVVTEVVFDDLSSISLEQAIWEPLPEEKELLCDTLSPNLLEQYQITYGDDCCYKAKIYKDLWQCACGHFSKMDHLCPICGNANSLLDVNLEDLQKECNDRLEAEAKQAEEDRIKFARAKKKLMIASIIAAPFVILLIVFGCLSSKYNEVINSDFYGALSDSLEEFDSSGFVSTMEYDFFDKKISMNLQEKNDNGFAIYDPNADITLEQYTLYLTLESTNNQVTEVAYTTAKELGYNLDIEMNLYLNDDAKTLFMANKNGETIHFILDMQKEKAKVLPQMEKKVQTLLDEKKYYDVLDYIDDNIMDSNVDEQYITFKDSAVFSNAQNYANAMNKYDNSVSVEDFNIIISSLDEVDDSFRDTKDLKKTVKSEYKKIKSFSGTYTKPDGEDTDFLRIKDGKVTTGTIYSYIGERTHGTYPIEQKKENGKITYEILWGKISFKGSQVTLSSDTSYGGTYTKK